MDAMIPAVGAVVVSGAALVTSLMRRQSQLARNLYAELDLANERIQRLEAELAEALDKLHRAEVKVSPELLSKYADEAVAYAEQVLPADADNRTKLKTAIEACIRKDAGDNNRRDWSDAEHRIAIEAAVARRKAK